MQTEPFKWNVYKEWRANGGFDQNGEYCPLPYDMVVAEQALNY
jgi:hypothetical protein